MTSINKKRTTSSSNTVGSADTHGTTAKRPKIVVSVNHLPAVDSHDFCSEPNHGLSESQMHAIQSLTSDVIVLTEKELVGKGTKKLYKLDNALVFLFDGKKCIKKDRMRIQAMMDAATAKQSNDDENPTQKYVLLTTESGICKRNTLPELIAAGYIVQRAPPAGHEGSM
uniref:Uncharacterized protein n=1 Tax=Amphora coffeiformis TaxID=265554 RepID=A0A7S3L1E7_9STRA